ISGEPAARDDDRLPRLVFGKRRELLEPEHVARRFGKRLCPGALCLLDDAGSDLALDPTTDALVAATVDPDEQRRPPFVVGPEAVGGRRERGAGGGQLECAHG